MKKIVLFSVVFLLISMVGVSGGDFHKKHYELQQEINDDYDIVYEYNFDKPDIEKKGEFDIVQIEGLLNMMEPGEPNLPVKGVDLLLPKGEEIKNIEIVVGEKIKLGENFLIEPKQKQYPLSFDGEFEFVGPNKKIYNSKKEFPGKLFDNGETHYLSGHSIGVMNLYPVQYVPASGELFYYKSITVKINTEKGEKSQNAIKFFRENAITKINKLVDNPMGDEIYVYSKESGDEYDILLITNEALLPYFSEYVEFKDSTGFLVKTITIEEIYSEYMGDDEQEKIRNCIIDYYIEHGISYVILGGDSVPNNPSQDIIPHRGFYVNLWGSYIEYDIPADMYYACLDGTWNDDGDDKWGEPSEDDLYCEVGIGRLAVDSSDEIQDFVNKLILYQNNPVVEDIEKALMVGEKLWDDPYPQGTYAGPYKDEVAEGSSNYGYTTEGISDNFEVDTLYEIDYIWPASVIFDYFNNGGINLLNHLGHSSTNYNMKMYSSQVNTANFQNDGITRGFVIGYSQGCYAGSFDNRNSGGSYSGDDCFAEKITTLETGEVAFIANSRYGWGSIGSTNGASQYFDRQFFDAIFGEDITIIGDVNGDSKEDNIAYINGEDVIRWCAYELNLFGDPTMDIWTEQPVEINVDYPEYVGIGEDMISFYIYDASDVRISIMQNGEVIGNAMMRTGETSHPIVVDVDLFSPIMDDNPLNVSIIGHNKIRHLGDILISC